MEDFKHSFVDVELSSGRVHRSFQNITIGEGDAKGDRFGVRLYDNGEPLNTTGMGAVGFFTRPDGVTLVLDGFVSGNRAWVTLPAACYAREGNYSLAIKITGTGFANTLRIVDGTVVDLTTGTISDPSSVIPDLDPDYDSAVEEANTAADIVAGLYVEATQIEGTRYQISVTKE